MQFKPSLMLALLIAASSSLVSGCATKVTTSQSFPSVSDLASPPKPTTNPEALVSDAAEKQDAIEIEAWGDTMAAQIGRLCQWARDNGMRDAPCKR